MLQILAGGDGRSLVYLDVGDRPAAETLCVGIHRSICSDHEEILKPVRSCDEAQHGILTVKLVTAIKEQSPRSWQSSLPYNSKIMSIVERCAAIELTRAASGCLRVTSVAHEVLRPCQSGSSSRANPSFYSQNVSV
jgi:hypothetical protein